MIDFSPDEGLKAVAVAVPVAADITSVFLMLARELIDRLLGQILHVDHENKVFEYGADGYQL